MNALTIRKIPSKVEKVIRDKAVKEHVSLSKAVVEMLEASVLGKQKQHPLKYHDLDWIVGTNTEKQASAFSKYVTESRVIDQELWK